MTENSDRLIDEQITKEPEKVQKEKDPKKVAAGKRLAEYHKKAKKALEQEKNTDCEDDKQSTSNWMPEISLTTALSLAGITLTALDLYFRFKKNNTPTVSKIEDYEEKHVVKPKIHAPTTGME